MSGRYYRCPYLAEQGIDPYTSESSLGIEICNNCPDKSGCILDQRSTQRPDKQKRQTLERTTAVLRLKKRRKNRKEIAEELGVSVSSVDFYYRKRHLVKKIQRRMV